MEEKKREEIKVTDKRGARGVKEVVRKVKSEQSSPVESSKAGPGQAEEEKSIREMQAEEQAKAREFDVCPECGTHSMQASIQPKIPLPIGDGAILIALPMLVCVNCTNVYMPRSYVTKLLNMAQQEQQRVVTP